MKRRRKLGSIPNKKVKKEFCIDEYIEKQQARKEYGLLDKLIDSFVEFIDTEKELPFIYNYNLRIYNLTSLEKRAVNNFKYQMAEKGYTCEYEIKDMDPNDDYPWMRLIVTVK